MKQTDKIKIGDNIRSPAYGNPLFFWTVREIQERGLVVTHGLHSHRHLKEWSELEPFYTV